MGGRQKIKKIVPCISWEKFKISGGVLTFPKSPKFQRVPKTNKMMTHFHIMRTKKHKILSIVVLNMAKYTNISLILVDFVPIFFIVNLIQNFKVSPLFSSGSFPQKVNFFGVISDIYFLDELEQPEHNMNFPKQVIFFSCRKQLYMLTCRSVGLSVCRSVQHEFQCFQKAIKLL